MKETGVVGIVFQEFVINSFNKQVFCYVLVKGWILMLEKCLLLSCIAHI